VNKPDKEPCVVCGKRIVVWANEPRLCYVHRKCPRCGGDVDPHRDEGENVRCSLCGEVWTSKGFVDAVVRKNQHIKCPYCKGAGTIPASKEIGCWDEST